MNIDLSVVLIAVAYAIGLSDDSPNLNPDASFLLIAIGFIMLMLWGIIGASIGHFSIPPKAEQAPEQPKAPTIKRF